MYIFMHSIYFFTIDITIFCVIYTDIFDVTTKFIKDLYHIFYRQVKTFRYLTTKYN